MRSAMQGLPTVAAASGSRRPCDERQPSDRPRKRSDMSSSDRRRLQAPEAESALRYCRQANHASAAVPEFADQVSNSDDAGSDLRPNNAPAMAAVRNFAGPMSIACGLGGFIQALVKANPSTAAREPPRLPPPSRRTCPELRHVPESMSRSPSRSPAFSTSSQPDRPAGMPLTRQARPKR